MLLEKPGYIQLYCYPHAEEVGVLPKLVRVLLTPGVAGSANSNTDSKFATACATFKMGDWALHKLNPAIREARTKPRLGPYLDTLGHKYSLIQVCFLHGFLDSANFQTDYPKALMHCARLSDCLVTNVPSPLLSS